MNYVTMKNVTFLSGPPVLIRHTTTYHRVIKTVAGSRSYGHDSAVLYMSTRGHCARALHRGGLRGQTLKTNNGKNMKMYTNSEHSLQILKRKVVKTRANTEEAMQIDMQTSERAAV